MSHLVGYSTQFAQTNSTFLNSKTSYNTHISQISNILITLLNWKVKMLNFGLIQN